MDKRIHWIVVTYWQNMQWYWISFCVQAVGTPLLPHQKQALSWMCARENKSSLPPFWEKRGELYYNSLTCFSAKEVPERVCGGILADDMGLVRDTHSPQTSTLCCDLSRHEQTPKFLHVFPRERLWQPLLLSSPTSTKEGLCLWRNVYVFLWVNVTFPVSMPPLRLVFIPVCCPRAGGGVFSNQSQN